MVKNKTSVRDHAVDIIHRVFAKKSYPDELIENVFRNNVIESADKALLSEIVNGTIRWHGYLSWILTKLVHKNYNKTQLILKIILEVSLYQIIYLDRIPDYAAISEGVEVAKKYGGSSWAKFVNGVLRNYLRKKNKLVIPDNKQNQIKSISINYSHPEWLIEKWIENYGIENTVRYCEYNNKRPELSVRVNQNKTNKNALIKELTNLGCFVEQSNYFDNFLRIKKNSDLLASEIFKKGYFTIQDESTAIPCLLLEPQRGDCILDMCSAPGGKSCYLAELSEDKGTILAMDIQMPRLDRLKQNVNRLDLKSIRLLQGDAGAIRMRKINKILIDAPCSGLGVLSKRVDLRWRRTKRDILNIKEIQQKILQNAANLLEKNGIIVYNTCTLEKEETIDVIRSFITLNPEFVIDRDFSIGKNEFRTNEGYWRTLPFEHGIDGTFSARMVKRKNKA